MMLFKLSSRGDAYFNLMCISSRYSRIKPTSRESYLCHSHFYSSPQGTSGFAIKWKQLHTHT